jgi:hypothetical protein
VATSPGIGPGRPVQRVLQGTHRVQGRTSPDGGTSQNGTHRAPPPHQHASTKQWPFPRRRLCCPPGSIGTTATSDAYPARFHFPGSPVIGRDAPARLRSPLGRGGPLQFPPSLPARSEPLTPGSPSRLRLQGLHRFRGLRPYPRGPALPRPRPHEQGGITTRQATLHVTDRTVARPHRALDAGLRPGPFPDETASLLPGLLTATRTGLPPASNDEHANQRSLTYVINHQSLSGRTGDEP